MDGQRFDALARSFAARTSRRTFVRTLGAGLVGALAGAGSIGRARAARDCQGAGGQCTADADCCQPSVCVDGHCCHPGHTFCKGRCVPGCPASDQCHEAGVLDPETCSCSAAPKPNGTACDDGNPCTSGDVCTNGVCGGTPVSCPQCQACVGGQCQPDAAANGTACNDGNACTTGDVCSNGVCAGTPTACGQCLHCVGGRCVADPGQEGAPCDDGNLCTRTDVCQLGICVGRDPVVCRGSDNPCKLNGTCDPATGLCNDPGNVPDGTPCTDGNPCTANDTCQGGKCVSGSPLCDRPCASGEICIENVDQVCVCARRNEIQGRVTHP